MIVGIESHVCVLQTTLDLLSKGVNVFVIRDAVSSCNKQEIPVAIEVSMLLTLTEMHLLQRPNAPTFPLLQRMRLAGATVTTSESALFELMCAHLVERFTGDRSIAAGSPDLLTGFLSLSGRKPPKLQISQRSHCKCQR